MIKIHKWTCIDCDEKWFLRVETDNELEMIRYGKFEEAITKHVMEFQHEIKHNEKGDTVFKFA